jgi:hypothetical protein
LDDNSRTDFSKIDFGNFLSNLLASSVKDYIFLRSRLQMHIFTRFCGIFP